MYRIAEKETRQKHTAMSVIAGGVANNKGTFL